MKKLFYIFTIILFFSCTGTESDNKITIWTQASADHPEGIMFAERIQQYQEDHPNNIPVELVNITRAGAGSGYIDRLNAAITSHSVPDLFTLDGPDVAAYVDSGVIGELNSIMSPEYLDGFTPNMIKQGEVNNNLYALAYQDSNVAVMYNQDIFLALPQEIQDMFPTANEDWTWQEFHDLGVIISNEINKPENKSNEVLQNVEVIADFLTSDPSKGAYETGTYFFTPMIWSNNGSIIAKDGLTVEGILNSPQNLETLSLLGSFFRDDLAQVIEPEKAFATKKAVFAIAGFWFINDYVMNYPSLKFQTVRYPKVDINYTDNYTASGSWAFVRSSEIDPESEKAKQVAQILEYLTDDNASQLYFKRNGSIPARKKTVGLLLEPTGNEYADQAWSVIAYQVANTNKARPASLAYPYLSETFTKDILLKIAEEKAVDTNDVKDIVDSAIEKLNFELDRYKK